MNQMCFKMTSEMKKEFQNVAKRRAENPSELVRDWIEHYINEYKEEDKKVLTIKRCKVSDELQGIDYIDEYELEHSIRIAKNALKDIVSAYYNQIDVSDQNKDKKIKELLNLKIGELTLDIDGFSYHIKNELLTETLYGLYKNLDKYIDLTSLSFRDIRFDYYINLNGRYIILTKEGELLKEWNDNATLTDIFDYLKEINYETFIK